jgi:hypothetical protein
MKNYHSNPDMPWPYQRREEIESSPSRNFNSQPAKYCSHSSNTPNIHNIDNNNFLLQPPIPIRAGPIPSEEEKRIRRFYISLLQSSGVLLELPIATVTSACIFFHRFYSICALQDNHPLVCCCACILLSSKVEEHSRRVRDIMNVLYRLCYPSLAALSISPLYWQFKDNVLRFEQLLLRVINFETILIHPQHYILHFAREIECSEELTSIAFYICNDSLLTTLILQYSSSAIACSAIYLAAEFIGETINLRSIAQSSSNSEWWEYFSCSRIEIEDCSHQLLELYELSDNYNNSNESCSTPGLTIATQPTPKFIRKSLAPLTPPTLVSPATSSNNNTLNTFTNNISAKYLYPSYDENIHPPTTSSNKH